jgi:protein-S-isoprenylcysteine O-methyltransferase Ste14
MTSIAQALLAVAVVGAIVCTACLGFSILHPASRIWPVPARNGAAGRLRTLLNRATGPVIGVSATCLLIVAAFDYGSLQLPAVLHLPFGAVLFCAGGALAGAGYRTLGVEISTGTPGDLEVRGPYRLSRNPQYVGTAGAMFGFALLVSSRLVLFGAISWSAWFLIAPLAEEPWLRALLGKPYESYLHRTRRYL